MRRTHRVALVLPAVAGALLISSSARAAELAVAGTPEHEGVVVGKGIRPGLQLEANAGSGFSDLWNLGAGGRLGFTTGPGVYLGANADHFVGRDVLGSPHSTFVGGEAGLKIFPLYRLETRPYGFVGAEIPSNGSNRLAIAPGVVIAYHFGRAFIDVDGRYLVEPPPQTFMLMGGVGAGF
jgi:hypothetical protein